jgi:hypothetical protein
MKKLKKIINILISNDNKSNKKWDVVNRLKQMKKLKMKN